MPLRRPFLDVIEVSIAKTDRELTKFRVVKTFLTLVFRRKV